MILQEVLDQALDILSHPEFKNYGALQKHRFQMSKTEEDKDNQRLKYEGCILPEEVNKKNSLAKKNNEKLKEINKKAAEKRKKWYKNPENYDKFMESIRRRKTKKAN